MTADDPVFRALVQLTAAEAMSCMFGGPTPVLVSDHEEHVTTVQTRTVRRVSMRGVVVATDVKTIDTFTTIAESDPKFTVVS